MNETRCKLQWYLPHNLVIKPPKSEKVPRICNAAAKYQGAALNYYLDQSLIRIDFCFRERQTAVAADIKAIFRQIAVPSNDNRCLQFLRQKSPEQKTEFYEYTWHFFVGNSCQLYALHQVAKDNAVNDENHVRMV